MPAHVLDERLAELVELAPQAPHVYVEDVGARVGLEFPDLPQQILARDELADRMPDVSERRLVDAQLAHQCEAGVPILWVSASSGEGVHALHAAIARRTCVFVGQSGVGKSSLLNQLDPDSARRTGAEREKDGKGRHTTTGSRLVTLADGTRLVDTPGVRAFGLWADDRADLVAAFPDVDALADGCRFADCRHVSEPDCAVQAALSDGRLDSSRLEAWTRLIASLE